MQGPRESKFEVQEVTDAITIIRALNLCSCPLLRPPGGRLASLEAPAVPASHRSAEVLGI